MNKWLKGSGEYCAYCGAELLHREGKTVRYSQSGRQYKPYEHYRCPNFRWWTMLFRWHAEYIRVRRRPRL